MEREIEVNSRRGIAVIEEGLLSFHFRFSTDAMAQEFYDRLILYRPLVEVIEKS